MIVNSVAEGADYLLLGGYGGFDLLAARAVHEVKKWETNNQMIPKN